MGPFEMVVAIVAITAVAGVLRAKYGHRKDGRYATDDGQADLKADQLREEIRMLKERVATLERIVTDGSSSLDREIEALRRHRADRGERTERNDR